jgi:hypothetical protein
MKMDDLYGPLDEKKRKLTKKPSSETSLRDWFGRKGAPGKKGGWVDCNTCRKGKCKPCGRSGGEKRSKYPRCRPTPSACKGFKSRKSKKNEDLFMDLEQIIAEELETVLNEKKKKKKKKKAKRDACYHKVKSRYKVWPSAYASGALSKCRKVGAKNWGNSKKEHLEIMIEDELAQVLIERKQKRGGKKCWDGYERVPGKVSGEPGSCRKKGKKRIKEEEEKSDLKSKVIKALRDEGGAAGMDALKKHTEASKEEIDKVVNSADNIKVHEDGDIILMDSLEEKIEASLDEKKSPAWQRKAGKSKSGGLNRKGRKSYEKANPGSDLKAPVSKKQAKKSKGGKAAKRRKSFCARMKGMKKKRTSAKTARDPDSRINKALRKWDC